MVPHTRVMLVEVAAFPAAGSPGDLPAAEPSGLLAWRCGEPVVCHLRGPFRCRLAWRERRACRGGGGPGSGCSRITSLRPAAAHPGCPTTLTPPLQPSPSGGRRDHVTAANSI